MLRTTNLDNLQPVTAEVTNLKELENYITLISFQNVLKHIVTKTEITSTWEQLKPLYLALSKENRVIVFRSYLQNCYAPKLSYFISDAWEGVSDWAISLEIKPDNIDDIKLIASHILIFEPLVMNTLLSPTVGVAKYIHQLNETNIQQFISDLKLYTNAEKLISLLEKISDRAIVAFDLEKYSSRIVHSSKVRGYLATRTQREEKKSPQFEQTDQEQNLIEEDIIITDSTSSHIIMTLEAASTIDPNDALKSESEFDPAQAISTKDIGTVASKSSTYALLEPLLAVPPQVKTSASGTSKRSQGNDTENEKSLYLLIKDLKSLQMKSDIENHWKKFYPTYQSFSKTEKINCFKTLLTKVIARKLRYFISELWNDVNDWYMKLDIAKEKDARFIRSLAVNSLIFDPAIVKQILDLNCIKSYISHLNEKEINVFIQEMVVFNVKSVELLLDIISNQQLRAIKFDLLCNSIFSSETIIQYLSYRLSNTSEEVKRKSPGLAAPITKKARADDKDSTSPAPRYLPF